MAGTQTLKIVVIEDNLQMAEMIGDYLEQKFPHASITKFNTGESALAESNLNPDVIILDYNLDSQDPKALNGMQILMKIKKQFDAPVIFLSAQEKTDVSASIIKLGAYDYVVKNQQSFHRLEIIINNIISGMQVKKDLQSQKSSTKALIIVVVAIIAALVLFKAFG
ncbi:MAG: response regulator [Bacteroidota bacterium]